MFEFATRNRLRFPFRGLISTEDLWLLSAQDLDLIFKSLNSQLKEKKEESLLDSRTKEDEVLNAKIAIVKHIVKVKLQEEADKLKAKALKDKKQKILAIISEKQDKELVEKPIDELKKMLDELAD